VGYHNSGYRVRRQERKERKGGVLAECSQSRRQARKEAKAIQLAAVDVACMTGGRKGSKGK
jgi:hypothetical protein